MEVDDNLDAVRACPRDGLLQVGQLTSDVGLAGSDLERPVSDRDADVVKSECYGTISAGQTRTTL